MKEPIAYTLYKVEPSLATAVLFHGTGGDEKSLIPLISSVAPKVTLLGVRGQSTEEGVNRFFRRFGEGVFDEADIREKAADMAAFLRDIKASRGLGKLTAIGYSNGANMAAAMLLLYPEFFESLVSIRGVMPFAEPFKVKLHGVRALLLSAKFDSMAPQDRVSALEETLTANGCVVRKNMVDGGHNITTADMEELKKFLSVN